MCRQGRLDRTCRVGLKALSPVACLTNLVFWYDGRQWLVLRTATYLARWARGSVAFPAPRQRWELGRDVCHRVLDTVERLATRRSRSIVVMLSIRVMVAMIRNDEL
jgi:hypothetical protein